MSKLSAAPAGLSNASRSHSKLRARSPLSDEFCAGNPALVPASARNRPPFTRVHSHADAQKSSGAFFHDMDRERCRKRRGRARNALRGSHGVRSSTVMLKAGCRADTEKNYAAGPAQAKIRPILIPSLHQGSRRFQPLHVFGPRRGLFLPEYG